MKIETGSVRRRNYTTYLMDDGSEIYRPFISGGTYRLVRGPYCNTHTEILRDKFKICELEHAQYYIYPLNNPGERIDTHYAIAKPKMAGMILGWYVAI